jgi:hypothetical protein
MSEIIENQAEEPKVMAEEPREEVVSIDEFEALKAELQKVREIKDQFAMDSKKNAEKYRKLRDEQESSKEQKLMETNSWKELYEKSQSKINELSDKLNSTQKRSLEKDLYLEVAKFAPNAWDVEDVVRALPSDMIEVDKENLTINGVKEAISFLTEKKKHLFDWGNPKHGMSNMRPQSEPEKKVYAQLTAAEKAQLRSQKIREKFNR